MLEVRDVWFSYGDDAVLRGLDLTVEPGQIVGLLGSNGAGKTTTFRLLAGLLRSARGELLVSNTSVAQDPNHAKRIIGFSPDEPIVYERLSALENLNMFGLLWGLSRDETKRRAERLLRKMELWDVRNQWVSSYSRGMTQKLALCATLLHDPQVLLLDEPFTGLDVEAGLWARRLLLAFAEEQRAILFSSHIPELVEAIGTHVAILHEGRIASFASIEEVAIAGGAAAYFQQTTRATR